MNKIILKTNEPKCSLNNQNTNQNMSLTNDERTNRKKAERTYLWHPVPDDLGLDGFLLCVPEGFLDLIEPAVALTDRGLNSLVVVISTFQVILHFQRACPIHKETFI